MGIKGAQYFIVTLLIYTIPIGLTIYFNEYASNWGRAVRMSAHAENRIESHMHLTFDLGRTYLPAWDLPWLPDTLLLLLLFSLCMGLALEPLSGSDYRGEERLARFAVCLQTHGTVLLMRCTTTYVTMHLSSPVCEERWHDYVRTRQGHPDVFLGVGFLMNQTCFDMMFSGHCAISLLMCSFFQSLNVPALYKVLMWTMGVVAMLSTIIVGDHWTVDVLVAVYLTFFVYKFFEKKFLDSYLEYLPTKTHNTNHIKSQ